MKFSLRNSTLRLVSLLLFISLVGGALATSTRMSLSHPDKIESWLSDSNFYDGIIASTLVQAAKDDSYASTSISYGDPSVKAAAEQAITKQFIQTQINTVVDSNYAWLNGTVAKPTFSVDFSSSKQQFATSIAQTAEGRLMSLPVCTPSQALDIEKTVAANPSKRPDPLTIPCKPSDLNVAAATSTLKEEVSQNSSILPNTVLTQDNLNPEGSVTHSTPYYERLHWLPAAYRVALQLPWILGVMSLVWIAAIFALARRRRAAMKRLSVVFFLSGLSLIALKLGSDVVFRKLVDGVFTANTANGEVQHALTVFLQKVELYSMSINLLFGCAFVVIGVLGGAILYATKSNGQHKPKPARKHVEPVQAEPPVATEPVAHPQQAASIDDTVLTPMPSTNTPPTISVTAPLPTRSVTSAHAPTTAPELPRKTGVTPAGQAKPLRRRRLVQ